MSNIMNNYFTEITEHVTSNQTQLVTQSLENVHCNEIINFCYATEEEVKKEIINISFRKVTRLGDIPAKLLKANTHEF